MNKKKLLISGYIIKGYGRYIATNMKKNSLTHAKTLKKCKENLFFWCFNAVKNNAFEIEYEKNGENIVFRVYKKGN